MSKNKLKYDNLVFYGLCDALYREKCKSNYGSFSNMINALKISLKNGCMTSEHYKIIGNSLDRIETMYGLTYEDSSEYLLRFIDEELWRIHIKIVIGLNNLLKNY